MARAFHPINKCPPPSWPSEEFVPTSNYFLLNFLILRYMSVYMGTVFAEMSSLTWCLGMKAVYFLSNLKDVCPARQASDWSTGAEWRGVLLVRLLGGHRRVIALAFS